MSKREVVIVSGARTPMGAFQGALASIPAPKLGATAIKAALERAGVKPEQVDEVYMGCVLQAGLGQAPARQAAIFAGLPNTVPCSTVNKAEWAGTINLVYGVPSEISEYLIPHPVIKKMSFTGSTVVGKQLAAIAGAHMKRVTMELGGHAPAIVFDDADVDAASRILAGSKYRNAGQVCVSPTRILVQEKVYKQFVDGFVGHTKNLKVGDGQESGTTMGPLANARRITAMRSVIP